MRLRSHWPLFVLFAFWFLVALPFFGPSFIPTHDGEYHIIRIYEFFKVLSDGVIIPRWAPGLNSGYGIPLFNFNYPFPNYVGSIFHFLGIGYIQSFKFALISGYGLSLVFCYLLFCKRFPGWFACAITLIFGTVPYWFVDVNIRGSIGEVWAITWMMATFASIEWEKPKLLAITIGLLIISHNILAMLFVPLIFVYLLFLKKRYFFPFCIGVLAATYFWLPALAEKQYVIGLNSVTFSDHFPSLFQLLIPSWGSGFSAPEISADEMSQQIGICALSIFVLSFVSIFRSNEDRRAIRFFLIALTVVCILMVDISIPIWNILSPLQLIQYPWRLLSVILIITPFLAALVMKHWKPWAIVVVCLASILFSIGYVRPVLYQHRDDSYYLSDKSFTDGTNSMGNSFSTVWTSWKNQKSASRVNVIAASASVEQLQTRPMSDSFSVNTASYATLEVNRLYFPGWQVFIDGKSVPINYKTNGTLEFIVPSGFHQVTTSFNSTPIRFFANIVSILAIMFILGSIVKRIYAHRI
jgi:hypothetical protein